MKIQRRTHISTVQPAVEVQLNAAAGAARPPTPARACELLPLSCTTVLAAGCPRRPGCACTARMPHVLPVRALPLSGDEMQWRERGDENRGRKVKSRKE